MRKDFDMALTNYEKFNLAVERNAFLFPTMRGYSTVKKTAVDITSLFLDDFGSLPDGYSQAMISEDEVGPIFVLV